MADLIQWSCEDIVPDCKIPGDVLVSILTYLPVISLLKFKAVSKPWCCFISSPRFCKLHLHRQSLIAANNCLVLLFWGDSATGSKHGVLDLSPNYTTPADNNVLILELSPLLPLTLKTFVIIGSSNGLVCLGNDMFCSYDLILWNPATRRYRSLHLPKGDDLRFSTLGLCYVDAIDDFKILGWSKSRHLYVYSLSSDSWDKFHFDCPKTYIHFERPTFMGRCMHWLSITCPSAVDCTCSSDTEIGAFDVMDGVMSWYRLPVNRCPRHLTVTKPLIIEGCLSIVFFRNDVDARERGFEVWVMEEYGVEGSWVKRFSIHGLTQIENRFPLVTWLKGEFVVSCINDVEKKDLILYDPYSEKTRYVKFLSYEVNGLFNYVESLASVGT